MFQTRIFSPAYGLALLIFPLIGFGQDESDDSLPQVQGPTVTVTANRGETPYDQVGSSVSVVTAADLERAGVIYVADALRLIAGLDIVQTGGPGRATSVFIRGAESGHTLVIIDGIEAADTISVNSSYDLGHLTVDNIERIEIVRGPQSTLYGSDALGGVIHIITKKGEEGFVAQLKLEGGSYATLRQQLSAQGGNQMVKYAVSGSYFENDGFSTASERLNNLEDDGYRNNTLSARLDVTPNDAWYLNLNARLTDAKSDLDNGGGFGQDDPNHRSDYRETFLKVQSGWYLFEQKWNPSIDIAYTDQAREVLNPTDVDHPNSSSDSGFYGEKVKINFHNQLSVADHQLTFGAETEEEKGDSFFNSVSSFGPFNTEFSQKKARTTGIYIQDHILIPGGLALTLGGRFDDHENFGSQATYRVAVAYDMAASGTIIRASYGTGFKAPSLFQLFSSFGDENLDPEESIGLDISIDQRFGNDRVHLGVTYFRNDFESLITFSNTTFAYANINNANTEGIEARAAFKFQTKTWLSLNLSYLETEDESTGLRLLRRPKQKANLTWSHVFAEWAQAQVDVRYVGERDFQDFSTFPATRTSLDDFTLANLSGRFTINQHLNVFARVENLFDESYEEVLGYGTAGFSGYFGIGLNL